MSTLFRGTDNTNELGYIAYSKIYIMYPRFRASQEVLVVKNLPANVGDVRTMGSIPGLGGSPGGGHGNSLRYS